MAKKLTVGFSQRFMLDDVYGPDYRFNSGEPTILLEDTVRQDETLEECFERLSADAETLFKKHVEHHLPLSKRMIDTRRFGADTGRQYSSSSKRRR